MERVSELIQKGSHIISGALKSKQHLFLPVVSGRGDYRRMVTEMQHCWHSYRGRGLQDLEKAMKQILPIPPKRNTALLTIDFSPIKIYVGILIYKTIKIINVWFKPIYLWQFVMASTSSWFSQDCPGFKTKNPTSRKPFQIQAYQENWSLPPISHPLVLGSRILH